MLFKKEKKKLGGKHRICDLGLGSFEGGKNREIQFGLKMNGK